MATGVTIELQGFDELYRELELCERKVARPILSGAMRAGAKRLLNKAKDLVPVALALPKSKLAQGYRPGDLKRSLKVRATPKKRRGTISFSVITGKGSTNLFTGDNYYGGFIEFGTGKMAAQPFLRPAFDSQKGPILEAIKTQLRWGLDRNWQKQALALTEE